MSKDRVTIPPETAAAALFASDYTCCCCRERGRPVQTHHIDEDPSNNADENLAVLCIHCHNDTQIKGGFGRKLDAKLVIRYRDDWVRRVVSRRDKADELAALQMAGMEATVPTTEGEAVVLNVPSDKALTAYVNSLPAVLAKSYAVARPRWDSGVTAEMVQATYDLIDVVIQMLVHLGSWFPRGHFDGKSAPEYFSQFVSSRFNWHRALAEPKGIGTGGTIVGTIAAGSVLEDVESATDQMVAALLWNREEFSVKAWRHAWEQSKNQNHPQRAAESAAVGQNAQNLILSGIRITTVSGEDYGRWTRHPYSEKNLRQAAVLQFTNEARRGVPNVGGPVKAHIVYRNQERELLRIVGCWLDGYEDRIEFPVDESRELLVALLIGDQPYTVASRRIFAGTSEGEVVMKPERLTQMSEGTVTVRLTNGATGDFLFERDFLLSAKPLSLVEL